jgi:hypothetical protein
MANVVKLNPEYFPNPDRGRPVNLGSVYVGKPDLDPEVVANQKQVSVQQEDGSIVNVSQPVSLSAGGVPTYNGSPVTLLVDGDYSLKVLNSSGSQVYYVPSDLSLTETVLSSWGCDIAEAVTAIGATETTLIVDCTATIADGITVTIPSTMTLQYVRGGLIQGTAGGGIETLVINGGLIADPSQQIFGSNLTVTGTFPSEPAIEVTWFGTNSAAFVAAGLTSVAANKPIHINHGSYTVSDAVTCRGIYGNSQPEVPEITLTGSGAFTLTTAAGEDLYRYVPLSNLYITSTVASATFVTVQRRRVFSRGLTMAGSATATQIGVLFDLDTSISTFNDFDSFNMSQVDYPFKFSGTNYSNSSTIGHNISGNYIVNCVSAFSFAGTGFKQGNTFGAYVEASTNVAEITTNTAFWNTFKIWQDVVTNTMTLGATLGQPNFWFIQDKSNYSYTGGAFVPSNDLVQGLDDYWMFAGTVNQTVMSMKETSTWYGFQDDSGDTALQITGSAMSAGQDLSDTNSRKYRDDGFLVGKYKKGISFYDSTNDVNWAGLDTTGFWSAAALQTQSLSAGGTVAITPTKNFLRLNCTVATTVNLGETDVMDGFRVTIVNIGAADVTFTDTAGVMELAGNFLMGQYDSLEVIYSSDRWIEVSRSGN